MGGVLRRIVRPVVLAAVIAAGLGGADAHVADAAFPGTNGKIAFVSDRDGNFEIYSMNADGTSQTRLTHDAAADMNPAWSPDGAKLAFSSTRASGQHDVYVMDADGTDAVQLTDNGSVFDSDPAWSPDGTKIVFASNRDDGLELYVMGADGSGVVRLTNSAGDNRAPAWSPDGKRIAFQSTRDGGNHVYAMNADGSGQTSLTAALGSGNTLPDWSPDGAKLVFTRSLEVIMVMNADGSGAASIPDGSGGANARAAWSPDCTRLVFVTDRDGGDQEVYTMAPDGSGLARLTASLLADTAPDWQRAAAGPACGTDPAPLEPTVTSLTPSRGPATGGTSVAITGTDFTGATAVSFGTEAAAGFTVESATQITATTPAHAAGTVDVSVTTPAGTSADTAADDFVFEEPPPPLPAVTSLAPSSGPTTGGTSVTITGTDFTGATAVSFGAEAAAGFTVDSATQITATTPAHAAGTVDVSVTTPAGTSANTATDDFTFEEPPPPDASEYRVCRGSLCLWSAPLGDELELDLNFDGTADHRAVLALDDAAGGAPALAADFRLSRLDAAADQPFFATVSVQLVDAPPDTPFLLAFDGRWGLPASIHATASIEKRAADWHASLAYEASQRFVEVRGIVAAGGHAGRFEWTSAPASADVEVAFANGVSTLAAAFDEPLRELLVGVGPALLRRLDAFVLLQDVSRSVELSFGRRTAVAGTDAFTFPTLGYRGSDDELDVRASVDPRLFGGDPRARFHVNAANLGRETTAELQGNAWTVSSPRSTDRITFISWAQLRSSRDFSGCAPASCRGPARLAWEGRTSIDPLSVASQILTAVGVRTLTLDLGVVSAITGDYTRFDWSLDSVEASVDYSGRATACAPGCSTVVGPAATRGTTSDVEFHLAHQHWAPWLDQATLVPCRPGSRLRLLVRLRPHPHGTRNELSLLAATGGGAWIVTLAPAGVPDRLVHLAAASLSPKGGGVSASRYCG